ncbi:putative retrotransposon hot spot protein (RHS) [Trypanosoma cruzi]|uniref:Putative retrotransposon hot spot protein (RHS) n=1 Tax=Trypanosoma cruzi TaxID=5693 RepID=A0A2V2UHS0_TRYCR|nr:putative retrotransposon hot spot protein (RHS) [Trypanosoma cruzi]
MDRRLNELLNRRFDGRGFCGRQSEILAGGVFKDPEKYICDAGVLGEMQASDRYVMMERTARDEMDMAEDVHKLCEHCMDNLLRWLVAAAVTASVHEINKMFFGCSCRGGEEPNDDECTDIPGGTLRVCYNARWHHVVEVPGGEGTGMDVRLMRSHRSHGRTGHLATPSKRMTVCSNPVHHVPG